MERFAAHFANRRTLLVDRSEWVVFETSSCARGAGFKACQWMTLEGFWIGVAQVLIDGGEFLLPLLAVTVSVAHVGRDLGLGWFTILELV